MIKYILINSNIGNMSVDRFIQNLFIESIMALWKGIQAKNITTL